MSPPDAPRPGDPRSRGPRPRPVARDLVWAATATALVTVTAAQLVGLAVALLRLEVRITGPGAVLGFVVTVVWLVTIHWLVLGAWRRSVWGCPFDHTADAPEARRCVRHGIVDGPA